MNKDIAQSDPAEGARDVIERELERHPQGYDSDGAERHTSEDERPAVPKTDDVSRVAPLSGTDRSGLGAKGWAEVPEDGIGGHPELEVEPVSGPDGKLDGPRPKIDPKTGAPLRDAK